mgnify:FL=1
MARYLFVLSREHPPLAAAECRSLHQEAEWEDYHGHLLGTVGELSTRMAFTRRCLEVLHRGGDKEGWPEPPRPEGTVRVERLALDGGTVGKGIARRMVLDWLGRPEVDLERPDETYWLVSGKGGLLVCREAWTNTGGFQARANQRRPAPHPTSLPPKLARAMVNLAGPVGEVLDPFCGSGGILLEASLMGVTAKGVDIDEAMLDRARRNLAAYGAEAELVHGDALEHEEEAECVVTDLPYGRSSKAEDLEGIYRTFLTKAHRMTRTMVVGFPDLVDGEALAEKEGWSVRRSFDWPLHRGLRKRILVLHSWSSEA